MERSRRDGIIAPNGDIGEVLVLEVVGGPEAEFVICAEFFILLA